MAIDWFTLVTIYLFVDRRCEQHSVCRCTTNPFSDGHSCADMCTCLQNSCNSIARFNCTNEGTNFTSWISYENRACWDKTQLHACEWNLSLIICILGTIVIVSMLSYTFAKVCFSARTSRLQDPEMGTTQSL
jgi:hypothetical protein